MKQAVCLSIPFSMNKIAVNNLMPQNNVCMTRSTCQKKYCNKSVLHECPNIKICLLCFSSSGLTSSARQVGQLIQVSHQQQHFLNHNHSLHFDAVTHIQVLSQRWLLATLPDYSDVFLVAVKSLKPTAVLLLGFCLCRCAGWSMV